MIRYVIAFLIAVSIFNQALAGGAVTAKVVQVRIDQSGQGVVTFSQPLSGSTASCADSGYANALAFNTNTAAGKAIMALALAAKATGDTVSVYGTGTCSIYGNWIEDWSYGVTQ